MHELSVIQPIVRIASKIASDNGIEKVTAVRLAIGELHDLQEVWVNKYYLRFSKGTPLEDSKLVIRKVPITFRCCKCKHETSYTHFSFAGVDVICPECGSAENEMISGRELQIEGLEYLSREQAAPEASQQAP